ncbi:solute carrier family 2, facilitated glucose transporter member 5-like isoform X1 [Petromyzon marinus]|uniref:Solute carrier family 2, facilitated glucose transporter member 5-like isoform X1 n=1 Tax=Petromyzon marinus TaxID=7757 RepID=A0AAJ7T119_PETMA|nr:solute carrier family 2, facilitated glucose transporter member 5-like isoform X1 [Petromyzon marinus]
MGSMSGSILESSEARTETNGGRLTWSLFSLSLLVSLGSSALYGYNLAVVNAPAEYIKTFYNSSWAGRYGASLGAEGLTLLYSLTVSVFAIGGLTGSCLVGFLCSRLGRKGTLAYSSLLVFLAGALMAASSAARSFEILILGRLVTGVHSGIALSVVPMYLGEVAPKNLRGSMGLVPSVFICLGVFLAQFFGLREVLGKEESWPLVLSLIVVPAFIQAVLLPWFPESPRYLLIDCRDPVSARRALMRLRGTPHVQAEMQEMRSEQESLLGVRCVSTWGLLHDRSHQWQLLSVAVINLGMQLSAIDAIWFYTNSIFASAGIGELNLSYVTVGTGGIEILAGVLGGLTIERLGRRKLLIGGFVLMGLCSAGITFSLLLEGTVWWMPYVSVACVAGIIGGFCIGPAGIPFIITAELFRQSHRPAAYIVGGSLNWVSNFTVGFVFPFLQESAGPYCYLVFATVCILTAIYVYLVVPETRNRTFLEISEMFGRRSQAEGEGATGLPKWLHAIRLRRLSSKAPPHGYGALYDSLSM